MRRILLLLLGALTLAGSARAADLLWPLPGHKTITGGFADTRPDHFHGGLDLRTQGANLPVLAPTDGWVERLSVNPTGYGRVLYFRLADGRTAVFGHLSRFEPELESTLRDSQLVAGTYRVECVFDGATGRRFKRGETLAFTGQTGMGPPHLHYEVREGSVQTDPLANYPPADHDPPVIVSLAWTTLGEFAPGAAGRKLALTRAGDGWDAGPITASGPIAFYIQTYDPGPWGRNAVPSALRVKVGDSTVFEGHPARIDLLGPRDIYQKIVWAVRREGNVDLRRLFNLPPAPGYLDPARDGRGWIAAEAKGTIQIEVEDRAGNVTRVRVSVTAGPWPRSGAKAAPRELRAGAFVLETNGDRTASWASMQTTGADEVRLAPADFAFGDRLRLSYACKPTGGNGRPYFYELAKGWRKPLFAIPGGAPDSLSCFVLRAGTYGVAWDAAPPDLTLSVLKGRLKFRLTDAVSLIDDSSVRATVNGRTAIAEYEYEEKGGFIWTQAPLSRGSHAVTLTAADRAGNSKTWQADIHIP
jgi:hypothetical protein